MPPGSRAVVLSVTRDVGAYPPMQRKGGGRGGESHERIRFSAQGVGREVGRKPRPLCVSVSRCMSTGNDRVRGNIVGIYNRGPEPVVIYTPTPTMCLFPGDVRSPLGSWLQYSARGLRRIPRMGRTWMLDFPRLLFDHLLGKCASCILLYSYALDRSKQYSVKTI